MDNNRPIQGSVPLSEYNDTKSNRNEDMDSQDQFQNNRMQLNFMYNQMRPRGKQIVLQPDTEANKEQPANESFSLAQKIKKLKTNPEVKPNQKRPNLETITYLDKEFKISNEVKDSIKEKSCNEAKKSGHCFNFTFNQSMNPQTDAQKQKQSFNDIMTPKKDKMVSAKATKDKLHQAASQVVSPDGGSLYTGSRRNKGAVNTLTKTAKDSKKMSVLQTDRSFSGDRNLI